MIEELKDLYNVNDSGAAKLLGINRGTVSKYQNNKRAIPVRIAYHIDSLKRHSVSTRNAIKKDRL